MRLAGLAQNRDGGGCASSAPNITRPCSQLPYPVGQRSQAREAPVPGRLWKTWLFPGGVLLTLAAAVFHSPLFPQVAPSLSFFYGAVFAAGLLLAWRFNSSRILFSLLVLLLAHKAVQFFAAGQIHTGPGRTVAVLMAMLVPLNFIFFALIRERGLVVAGIGPRFLLLFLESVIVTVWCRPENSGAIFQTAAAPLPPWSMVGFAAGLAVMV